MIPLSLPNISENEWTYVKDCLDTIELAYTYKRIIIPLKIHVFLVEAHKNTCIFNVKSIIVHNFAIKI